ncbi:MAG: exodeoxyribonuclease VII large subunit [Ignavibacteriae bacterium]|nr:MAG: exodeoxyribonuclease VII large subunit [Ignavibacteriota bacterium]
MEFAVSVSEITSLIKRTLEESFEQIKVIGEISNFKAHSSGHWYFSLKDSNATINCTMWKGINNYVFFTPQDGMKVILTGRITVYPPRGTYQLDVKSMKPAGEGELQKAFNELKARLNDEGLFAPEHKKEIPIFPNKIGIVTGKDTAALRDMLNIAERRYPLVNLIIVPAKVQGEGAAEEITKNIKELNKLKDVDVIIVSRGGGSLEDLWAFNEEIVARAIFNSKIPVITGVGHEIDFTIADFVADLRAPTPSAAMELATPNQPEIFAFIDEFSYNSKKYILDKLESYREEIDSIIESYGFKNLINKINNRKQEIDNYIFRIQNLISNKITKTKNEINLCNKIVSYNNIEQILDKGFTLIEQDNKFIKNKKSFINNSEFNIKFVDGKVRIKQ